MNCIKSTVYLWPISNKMSRYFDEYYSELKNDSNLEILELNQALPIPLFLFKRLVTFSFFRKKILGPYLRKKKCLIHFTSQLHVYSDITDFFLFTFHDVLHLNSGLTGGYTPDITCLNIANAVKHSEKIITISNYSKNKISLYFRCNPDKVTIISNGIKIGNKFPTKRRKSLIFIGTNAPRKNLITFLETVKYYQLAYDSSISVVIISNLTYSNFELTYERIFNHLDINNLKLLNNISTEELSDFYKNEGILICPSLDEGFGLPILEAQSYGMPVIASDIPVFHEVFGDSVIYCNPNSYEDIALKINELFTDEERRNYMTELGYLNADKYTVESAAIKTIKLYKEILNA